MEKALYVAAGIVATVLIGLGLYAIVASARSNGATDYCYVEMYSPQDMAPQYQLIAHRPWRPDRKLGVYASLEDATNKAKSMECPLNK